MTAVDSRRQVVLRHYSKWRRSNSRRLATAVSGVTLRTSSAFRNHCSASDQEQKVFGSLLFWLFFFLLLLLCVFFFFLHLVVIFEFFLPKIEREAWSVENLCNRSQVVINGKLQKSWSELAENEEKNVWKMNDNSKFGRLIGVIYVNETLCSFMVSSEYLKTVSGSTVFEYSRVKLVSKTRRSVIGSMNFQRNWEKKSQEKSRNY